MRWLMVNSQRTNEFGEVGLVLLCLDRLVPAPQELGKTHNSHSGSRSGENGALLARHRFSYRSLERCHILRIGQKCIFDVADHTFWLQQNAAASGVLGLGQHRYSRWRRHDDHRYSFRRPYENEEVVPVNASTLVLLFGVTVGR